MALEERVNGPPLPDYEAAQRSYLAAVQEIFEEIAQGGLAFGLSHAEMGDALQDAIIAAAKKNAEQAGLNLDRIQSALFSVTAIPRKEIARRDANHPIAPSPKTVFNLVVDRWLNDNKYKEPKRQTEEQLEHLRSLLELKSETKTLTKALHRVGLITVAANEAGLKTYMLLRHAYAGTAAQLAAIDANLVKEEEGQEALRLLRSWRENPDSLEPAKLPKRAKNSPSLVGLIEDLESELGVARTGAEKKFEIRPKSIIEGLLISGLVRTAKRPDGSDIFELATPYSITETEFADTMYWFRNNVGDHLKAAMHNVKQVCWSTSDGNQRLETFFEQSIGWRFHQTPEFMEKVRTQIRLELEDGSKTGIGPDALSVIRKGVERISQDAPDGTSTHRLRMGVYYYDEPIE